MAEESDGIEEAFEGTLRVAVMAAGRVGEQIARQREQAARAAQAESQQRAAELSARLAAEQQAARATMATVYRPEWWESAQPEDIARAYQTAKAWGDVDPEAVRAEQRIAEELRNRFGVEVSDQTAGDPAAVREALDRAEHARAGADSARAAGRDDTLEGATMLAEADAVDRLAEQVDELREQAEGRTEDAGSAELLEPEERGAYLRPEEEAAAREDVDRLDGTAHELRQERDVLDSDSGVAYDSAERRQQMAGDLDGKADVATIEARVRADTAQGVPATEATRTTGTRAPKARKTRTAAGKSAQRTGLTR